MKHKSKLVFFIFAILLSSLIFASEKSDLKSKVLNLEAAQKIAAKVFVCGRKNNWKLSVAIVNSEGNLILFQRDDNSYQGSIEAAIDKAKSANAFQRPTKVFTDALKSGRIGLMTIKNIVAIEGGLPIQYNNIHVGAIGVSGAKSTEDEQCAKEALD